MSKTRIVAAAIAVALAAQASPTFAHHAVNSQFDVTQSKPLTGVLTKLDDLNPHAYWHFDVKGPDGKVSGWNIESVAPNALRRAGIRVKEEINVGETYNFTVAPSRNGSNTGLLLSLTVGGRTIKLTPN